MSKSRFAKLLTLVVIVAATYLWQRYGAGNPGSAPSGPAPAPVAIDVPREIPTEAPPAGRPAVTQKGSPGEVTPPRRNDDALIEDAFRNERSDVIVESEGRVSRVLPDDNEGSRHQRFIVRLESGRTVLIAHNIDLAPRVPLAEGDTLRFRGEYEWTDRGGVVHWTHHDPRGRREGGWLELAGKRYQ